MRSSFAHNTDPCPALATDDVKWVFGVDTVPGRYEFETVGVGTEDP